MQNKDNFFSDKDKVKADEYVVDVNQSRAGIEQDIKTSIPPRPHNGPNQSPKQDHSQGIDELNPFSFLNLYNLGYAIKTLWRNTIIILLLAIILALLVGYMSVKPQMYKAQAVVRILQIPASDEYYSEHVSQEAEMEVLKSFELVDKTLDKLQRNVLVKPKQNKRQLLERFFGILQDKLDGQRLEELDKIVINRFVMPEMLQQKDLKLTYQGGNEFNISKEGELNLNGLINVPINQQGVGLDIKAIYANKGDEFVLTSYKQYDLVKHIQDKLEIRKKGLEKFSGVLTIAYEDTDKDFINRFLKEYIKTYRDKTYERITKEIKERILQHELDLQQIDTKISIANVDMHEVQQKYKTVDHESEANLHLKNLIELEKRQIEIRTSLGKVRSTYTERHPTVISLKKQLGILANRITEIKGKIALIPDIHKKKFAITNTIESLKQNRIIVTEDLVRLKSRLQSTKNYITIVNGPQTVHKPYVKNTIKITIIAFVFGLFLTSLMVVIKSFITRGRRSRKKEVYA